jgi:hypothetical protein
MERWERIIAWWLQSPNNGYYTITREADTTNRYKSTGVRYVLRLTPSGKRRYIESLRNRIIGDGTRTQNVNGFQQAIANGDWVSPR